jgi:peptidoglycan/xylan/chitin deacetylase (PgdA/CDA1 family)
MEVLLPLLTYDLGQSPAMFWVRALVGRFIDRVLAVDWLFGARAFLRCATVLVPVAAVLFVIGVLAALKTPPPSYFVLDKEHRGITAPSLQPWHQFSDWVNHRKFAVLTFDDGPMGNAMDEEFMAILRKHHAHAIFFLVCNKINAGTKPSVGRMLSDGHMIGNHTFDHRHIATLPYEQVLEQIDSCSERIASVTGRRPYFFRSPYGHTSAAVTRASKAAGVEQMFWSASSYDYWYRDPEKIARFSLSETKDMSVLIMHERASTAAALDTVLTTLESRGFTFVLPREALM